MVTRVELGEVGNVVMHLRVIGWLTKELHQLTGGGTGPGNSLLHFDQQELFKI